MRKGEDLDLQDETLWRARRLKASYALWPKASRRNTAPPDISGVFEIWEKWVGLLCKGTINSAISKHPPGGRDGTRSPSHH